MVRSMTGFGRGEASAEGVRLTVEVKTVNHRYFSAALRLPREYAALEQILTAQVKERIERGHAAVTFELASDGRAEAGYALNREVVRGYVGALEELRGLVGASGAVDLAHLLALPGAVERSVRQAPDGETFLRVASLALEEALAGLVSLREQEGGRLAADLEERLAEIERAVARIELCAPEREIRERERLRAKLDELLDGRHLVSEDRLAQEVALLADRLDISEEITRFRGHVALFRETLAAGGPVGRQLTFVLQEMLREVNTMGSKASDGRIAQEVISVKNELEKLREQVENIE